MAWVDVEVSEEERRSSAGKWFKFQAIGDKVWGRFERYEQKEGKFGTEHNYTLETPEGTQSFNAPYDLHTKLQKAMRPPDGTSKGGLGLRPGVGHRICATYIANQDVGQASPMKVFRLQCDTAPAVQGQVQTQQRQPAPQAQTRPAQVRDRDILGPADPPQSAQRRQAAPPQSLPPGAAIVKPGPPDDGDIPF